MTPAPPSSPKRVICRPGSHCLQLSNVVVYSELQSGISLEAVNWWAMAGVLLIVVGARLGPETLR